MKPYGREKKVTGGQPWKKDYHPRKGYRNWWEDICDFLSRSTMKQINRKEIENEINENKEFFCNMTKMDIRLALIKHPNPNRIIINNFSDVYRWNVAESQYWNIIVFLEVVRQNNLWDKLEKLLEK